MSWYCITHNLETTDSERKKKHNECHIILIQKDSRDAIKRMKKAKKNKVKNPQARHAIEHNSPLVITLEAQPIIKAIRKEFYEKRHKGVANKIIKEAKKDKKNWNKLMKAMKRYIRIVFGKRCDEE